MHEKDFEMQKKQVTDLKYKDGEKVAHPMHLSNTSWNRDGVKKLRNQERSVSAFLAVKLRRVHSIRHLKCWLDLAVVKHPV